jgi:hypothetical protein
MNLWLMGGIPPSNFLESEIVIKSFSFTPAECKDPALGFWGIFGMSLGGFAIIGATIAFLVIRRFKHTNN